MSKGLLRVAMGGLMDLQALDVLFFQLHQLGCPPANDLEIQLVNMRNWCEEPCITGPWFIYKKWLDHSQHYVITGVMIMHFFEDRWR